MSVEDQPSWWTEQDDERVRAEVEKLRGLPRPLYVERRMHSREYVPIEMRRRRWGREVGAWIVLVAAAMLVLLGLLSLRAWPQPGPGPVVTPTTYG